MSRTDGRPYRVLDGEKKVTAGLRGASWDPAALPDGMKTQVFPLPTEDGAQIVGYLHSCGGERDVVMIMHPRELLVAHYLVPAILKAGHACWVQGARTVGNDIRLEHELALLDVAAGVSHLRSLDFRHVTLLGNSGGAGLFAFYVEQSSKAAQDRITHAPGGRPVALDQRALPTVDALALLAPHPGQGRLLMNMIDPSVVDEGDPLSVDPDLDPFSAANGFAPLPTGARYSPHFVKRYVEAQKQRVARIDVQARAMLEAKKAAKRAAKEGAPGADRAEAFGGAFFVWRTDADLRSFDVDLDPSDRRWGSVWGSKPLSSNLGAVGFGRVCTPESWLSTWSGLSSNASLERCGPSIRLPVVSIEYTGDNTVFPSDCKAIFDGIASTDKVRHRVRGNHHGLALAEGETPGQQVAGEILTSWLSEHFG